ncbi:uncharacterized protein I206_101113 [Kwoniella pini CBS 10737]|uniref:Uncharacterized protein n=1 Tax=Kwoniella pini CBS 10737 TaxID=1296096 RepID=A0A1B9IB69_9TREE|nr:uncharacterized protein I206_00213 [Kwoniella pini CBS 10737]OCF52912.1 hypothetical protein I206_00213 [Kwoniella pini CBS 10737]
MGITAFFSFTQGMATFTQVLLALPMTLDLLGPPSFLLLSLLFTLHHFIYSTLRLSFKNTIFAPIISILSFLSPFISFFLVLLTLYWYLSPPTASSNSIFPPITHYLVNVVPFFYAQILRWVSPLFVLLEGISTLLVIQVVGRVGKGWADEEEKDDIGIEWRSLLGLILAALVYCAGLAGVIKAFPLSSENTLPAFLLGCALTCVLFLSLIGFTLRRTNVLETSLVFVYVVYSAWLSGVEGAMEPRTYGTGWLPSPSSPLRQSNSLPYELNSISSLFNYTIHSVFSSFISVSRTLPPHLLLSLIYRVAVLHMAARIIPIIRKSSLGWDDGFSSDGADNTPIQQKDGFWDGKSLNQEPPNMRITTIVLSYRRAILIAVYTHLLLLDGGSQTWWRWINIALFLAVWSLELLLDAEGDDTESVTRWKVD